MASGFQQKQGANTARGGGGRFNRVKLFGIVAITLTSLCIFLYFNINITPTIDKFTQRIPFRLFESRKENINDKKLSPPYNKSKSAPHTPTSGKTSGMSSAECEGGVIRQGRVGVDGIDVFYREACVKGQPKLSALFLHGMAFTSANWEEIGTLGMMEEHGYRAVAIDLPSFGRTEAAVPSTDEAKIAFLLKLMENLKMEKVVLISPSMSGSYSIPFFKNHPEKLSGFVPIAPVKTDKYSPEEIADIEVPTMILVGSKDTGLGTASIKNLKHIKASFVEIIAEAGHPCYIEKPDKFHDVFFPFLSKLES